MSGGGRVRSQRCSDVPRGCTTRQPIVGVTLWLALLVTPGAAIAATTGTTATAGRGRLGGLLNRRLRRLLLLHRRLTR